MKPQLYFTRSFNDNGSSVNRVSQMHIFERDNFILVNNNPSAVILPAHCH